MRAIAEILARLAELERKMAGSARHGVVAEVDPGAGTVRLKLGEDANGAPFLSPPIPYAQTMGALKAHVPPSVGQGMSLIAPGGDWRQAVAIGLSANNANPSPSGAGNQNVITFGSVTITLTGGGLTIASGGVSVQVSSSGLTVTGGAVTHDGKNIGKNHTHSGVTPGGASTGQPN
jgi:hypothetical protein